MVAAFRGSVATPRGSGFPSATGSESSRSRTQRQRFTYTFYYLLVAAFASAVVGLVANGARYFSSLWPALWYVVLGLNAGLVHAAVCLRGPLTIGLMMILWFAAQVAVSLSGSPIKEAGIHVGTVGLAMLVGAVSMRSLSWVKYGRFVVLGLVLGLGYAARVLVTCLSGSYVLDRDLFLYSTFMGVALGVAMGVSLELVDFAGASGYKELSPFRTFWSW